MSERAVPQGKATGECIVSLSRHDYSNDAK